MPLIRYAAPQKLPIEVGDVRARLGLDDSITGPTIKAWIEAEAGRLDGAGHKRAFAASQRKHA